MGWEALQNGMLLIQAAAHFDVILTVDKRMKFHQNLHTLPVSVIVLDAPTNTPETLMLFAPFVEALLPSLRTGQMVEIDSVGKVSPITNVG